MVARLAVCLSSWANCISRLATCSAVAIGLLRIAAGAEMEGRRARHEAEDEIEKLYNIIAYDDSLEVR